MGWFGQLVVLTAALALAVVAIGPGAVYAQEPAGVATVNGRVVNGTAGGPIPTELLVLALATDGDGRLVATSQAFSDESGRFTVGELPLVEGGRYVFSADYAGMMYTTTLGPRDLSSDLRITVYESTEDVSVVRVTKQVQVIADVDKKAREIAAIEFVRLTNESDRTLLPNLANPALMSFLRFSLPPQAHDLNVQSDLPRREIISVGTGFAVTSPVLPGDHSIEFSYFFPYRGNTVSYRQALLQGAEVYQVLVPERLSSIRLAPLERVASVTIQDVVYEVWEGREINPSQGLMLVFIGLPEPGLVDRLEKSLTSAATWHIALPGALGAVLAFLLLFGALKVRNTTQLQLEPGVQTGGESTLGRASLIKEIADLDELFEKGEVPDAEYRERRQCLKANILESQRQTRGEDMGMAP